MSTDTTPIAPATPFKLSTEDEKLIADLIRAQELKQMSDVKFAREHLRYSATTWGRIKDGAYLSTLRNPEAALRQLRIDLETLQRDASYASRFKRSFFEFPNAGAILNAIEECQAKPVADPNRSVVYVADTGGGKSALCAEAAQRFRAVVFEGRESWKRSRYCVLKDFCAGLGIDTTALNSPDELEDAVIKELSLKRRVICIDEGEFMGPDSINLLKLLLNVTPTVILLTAITGAYLKWNRKHPHEAKQLRRRTHLFIQSKGVTADEARKFLEGFKLDATTLGKAAEEAAKLANQFGGYDALVRLQHDLSLSDKVDATEVTAAIKRVRSFQALETI